MTDLAALNDLIEAHYGARAASIELLPGGWAQTVYRVTQPHQPTWVLRLTASQEAEHDARVLAFLETRRYPAPRLIRSLTGAATTPFRNQSLLITTFIDGTSAGFGLPALHGIGELLGRLHTVGDHDLATLPTASMLPAPDLALARRLLLEAEPSLPAGLRDPYERLTASIAAIGPGNDLPQALIHNDCHPGNAIAAPDGAIILIDWHGAGLGPPVVDLAFLLISAEIVPSWVPPLPPDPRRLEAVVAGYARYRQLTPAELDWLPDVMRVRALLYGAAHLARSVEQALDTLPESWWWERCLAADETAARARREFARYSWSRVSR